MITVGIVGAGAIARAHARAFRWLSDGELRGQVDVTAVASAERSDALHLAAEYGVPRVVSVEEALCGDLVDAVVIASPSAYHAQQAELALRADKHVLCEIPLAMSLADVDKLITLATAHEKTLMVCHTLRYQPALDSVRDRILDGNLTVCSLGVRYAFLRQTNVGATGRARTWVDDILWHHGCHAVDTALWLFGDDSVDVHAFSGATGATGSPTDQVLALRSRDQKVASIFLSYNSHVHVFDMLVVTREATFVVTQSDLFTQMQMIGHEAEHPITRQALDFVRALADGTKPRSLAASIRPTMRILQAASEQARALTEPGPISPRGHPGCA